MAQTPTTDDVAHHIARIDRLTDAGRVNWFGLMAYLVFVFITMLGVEDADFFIPSRQTQLPLVNVAIPTESFFVFAPILGAALYVYLHLTVRKITGALCAAPATVDGVPLEDHLKPWLLVDLVLRWRNDGAIHRRPLDTLATLTVVALVWLAGPLVLAGLWMRTWPAHDEVMTVLAALSLMVTVYAGTISWVRLHRDLRGNPAQGHAGDIPLDLGLLFVGMTVLNLGWIKTETGALPSDYSEWWATLAPAQLAGVQFSVLPPDQADPVAARQRYRAEWCARQGMPPDICGSLPTPGAEPDATLADRRGPWCQQQGTARNGHTACRDWFAARDADFRTEWGDYRQAVIAALPKPDLSGRDLRGANLRGAELIGVNLSRGRMEGADLRAARMEGAGLRAARMEGADLRYARMEGADLSAARMEGADLGRARMEGADLRQARMEGANLSGARMEGAVLRDARMEGAVLWEARMEGADLSEARMEGADLGRARMEGADLSLAWMEGANLSGARMEGADLRQARMEGADLGRARMEGADLSGARMANANWARARNDASLAQFADLRGGIALDQARLSSLIGNAATLLPETPDGEPALYIPSCWAADPPGIEHLVAGFARYDVSEDNLRDPAFGFFCAPGEVPRKTGTPLAVDGDLPWPAQADDESDFGYLRRVEAWATEQPPGEPID